MAKKGTITVNILEENPLLTILKNGKVPIIRISDKGFQNYNQFEYFNEEIEYSYKNRICNKSIDDIVNGDKPTRGCFVQIGGIQGQFVDDFGCEFRKNQKICIGYLEPDEKIYITHTHKDSKLEPFSFVTAKERYLDSLEGFSNLYHKYKNKLDYYNFMDKCGLFDIYSEAIVDSTKIKKVIELEEDNIGYLLKYSNNRFLKILFPETLVFGIVNQGKFPKLLADTIGLPMNAKEENPEAYDNFKSRLYGDFVFYDLVENAFKNYYNNGKATNTIINYLNDFEVLVKDFAKINKGSLKNFKCITWKNNAICLEYFSRPIDFMTRIPKFEVIDGYGQFHLSLEDGFNLNYTKSTFSGKDINVEFSLNDCLYEGIRPVIYNILDFYEVYFDFLKKYIEIKDSLEIKFLREFKELEESIKSHLDGFHYIFDNEDKTLRIFLGSFIIIEYNFILDDFVIAIHNNYYNLENIPEEYEEIMSFTEILYCIIKKSNLYKNLKKKAFGRLFS